MNATVFRLRCCSSQSIQLDLSSRAGQGSRSLEVQRMRDNSAYCCLSFRDRDQDRKEGDSKTADISRDDAL